MSKSGQTEEKRKASQIERELAELLESKRLERASRKMVSSKEKPTAALQAQGNLEFSDEEELEQTEEESQEKLQFESGSDDDDQEEQSGIFESVREEKPARPYLNPVNSGISATKSFMQEVHQSGIFLTEQDLQAKTRYSRRDSAVAAQLSAEQQDALAQSLEFARRQSLQRQRMQSERPAQQVQNPSGPRVVVGFQVPDQSKNPGIKR